MKVVLGLSGGVDSALTAYLLKEQGYEVIGVYLENGSGGGDDARKVAEQVGIAAFRVVDIHKELEQHVIRPFIDSYLQGITPIPCIICNPTVKFKILSQVAEEVGAPYLATGHYAKIVQSDGERLLAKAVSKNDQSYMLYRLPKEYLNRLILPLGDYMAKDLVRQRAEQFGIPTADKPDSMEICFVPNDDHIAFIESYGTVPPPGDFVDETGKVLGQHKGIHHYTVGQRRGLTIATGSRMFVKYIDAQNNQVVLSDIDLKKNTITVTNPNIIYDKYRNLTQFSCLCKVRHGMVYYPCTVTKLGDNYEVSFTDTPARAPAPGQSAVFYEGDIVIGGGYIE